MKKFKFLIAFFFALFVTQIQAQENTDVQMATGFYSEGKIYIVISVIGLVFSGIVFYLIKTEMKIKKLEKEILEK